MPLSTLNEVQNQYALYFKQACLNTSQSFITRGSIKNGGASVGIENIEGHFTDQEIESKFKVLKESLRGVHLVKDPTYLIILAYLLIIKQIMTLIL
ncbi:hypothetical protein GW535_09955 [Piscirickettsia salmonis]|uniref:hypothetical protein n=1 Tax=Piscirickettsia salmonis TaxID=1238 RepID=UPI0012BAF705|nr:hypothetical protein [Piscirickettsia salmonis]QHS32771.1 hypothetical protein GW535_09955 [Piscirickettsia salmonis]